MTRYFSHDRLVSHDRPAALRRATRKADTTSSTAFLGLVPRIQGAAGRLVAALLVVGGLCASPALAQQGEQVALVKVVDGTAVVLRADERNTLDVGTAIFVADVVETEAGSVGLTFTDGTRLSIGPNSRVQFTEFQFAPTEGRLSFIIDVFRGTLLYVSGVIAKLNPEAVEVRTPVATVAVRGTRFLAEVEGD